MLASFLSKTKKIKSDEIQLNSKQRTKIQILLIVGIFFSFFLIIPTNLNQTRGISFNNSENKGGITLDNNDLELSKISGKIHIINNSGWEDFKSAGNCTGNGTYSDPYVIEDLVIDAGGGSESGIFIENSDVCFKIVNCTVFNSKANLYYKKKDAGIRFYNVENGQLIGNNCSFNHYGIYVGEYSRPSRNNTIIENTVNFNYWGIYITYSSFSNISRNTAIGNRNNGIVLTSDNSIILENVVKENGYPGITNAFSDNCVFRGNILQHNSYGLRLYYGNNNTVVGNTANYNKYVGIWSDGLGYNHTIMENNASDNGVKGIFLENSENSTILANTVNNGVYGIDLYRSKGNYIIGNTANNNSYGIRIRGRSSNNIIGNIAHNNSYGIYLQQTHFSNISGNSLIGNDKCIYEYDCQGNTFSDNGDCTYGQGDGIIPGYNLFFLLAILSAVATFISKKVMKS